MSSRRSNHARRARQSRVGVHLTHLLDSLNVEQIQAVVEVMTKWQREAESRLSEAFAATVLAEIDTYVKDVIR